MFLTRGRAGVEIHNQVDHCVKLKVCMNLGDGFVS
jgi:hypothetical protein